MTVIDIEQRCGKDGCIAWRLSRPDSGGQAWRPCWLCGTAERPTGARYGEAAG
jgi:hypothetical protein